MMDSPGEFAGHWATGFVRLGGFTQFCTGPILSESFNVTPGIDWSFIHLSNILDLLFFQGIFAELIIVRGD